MVKQDFPQELLVTFPMSSATAPSENNVVADEKVSSFKIIQRKSKLLLRFYPAILAYFIWTYCVFERGIFTSIYPAYLSMAIAMILGSFIAGSTPIGGGVVSFPVAVLIIRFSSSEGRDFGIMIQSISMSAAMYLICLSKPHLISTKLVVIPTLAGLLGVFVGFQVEMNSELINVVFTTFILCFAMVYYYKAEILTVVTRNLPRAAVHNSHKPNAEVPAPLEITMLTILFLCGVVGGFITCNVGSGADIMLYMFGTFIYNPAVGSRFAISEHTLTASAIMVMATLCIVTTFLRHLGFGNEPISSRVYLCWAASVPVVVLMAPLGSLILTPEYTDLLRMAFFVIAGLQFIMFAVFKIKGDVSAWIGISICVLLTVAACGMHYAYTRRTMKRRGGGNARSNSLVNRESIIFFD